MIILFEQSGIQNTIYPFDLRDRGLLLADGVFDTSLVVQGTMICRSAHVNRLVGDATALGIPMVADRIEEMIDHNLEEEHNGAFRITITSGPAERGEGILNSQINDPTILMSLSPLNKNAQFQPLSIQTSRIRRNPTSPTSRHKTLAYTDNIAAARSARIQGYDDALFLNDQGNVCCTTSGNVFLNIEETWVTPPISDGVLPGVMRQWWKESAVGIGLNIVERSIGEEELQSVQAAFMTNSIRLAAPIINLNGHPLPPRFPTGLKSRAMSLIGRCQDTG